MSHIKDDIQPTKRRLKHNSIYSSPTNSSNTDGKQQQQQSNDIIEMFAIKTTKSSSSVTTDISDTVFIETTPTRTTTTTRIKLGKNLNNKKTYQNRINERFKEVRNKVSKSTKKLNISKEITENADVRDVEDNNFFYYDKNVTNNIKIDEPLTQFIYAEKLHFNNEILQTCKKNREINQDIIEKSIKLQDEGFYISNKQNNSSSIKRPNFQRVTKHKLAKYIKPTIEYLNDFNEVLIINDNILNINIKHLKFHHHPLFNLEQVLGEYLRELCENFQQSRDNNLCEKLEKKLEILRNLKGTNSNISDDNIDKLQELVFNENKNQRDLIRQILNVWKSIKKIRNNQEYSSTKYRLIIIKTYNDYEEEKMKFEENFEKILQEKLDNSSITNRENVEEIRQKLQQRFDQCFKQPGEPILDFKLLQTNEITRNIHNAKEILRRSSLQNTKIYLRIVSNDVEICKLEPVEIDDDFACNFNETISIQFQQIPKEIIVEIVEQSRRFFNKILDKLTIKLPPQNITKDNRNEMNIKFECNEKIIYNKHNGVGNGVKLHEILHDTNSINYNKLLNTCGTLNLSIYWKYARNYHDNLLNNTNNYNTLLINSIIDKYNCLNFDNLKEWLNYRKPDPQDPKNSILYQFDEINNAFFSIHNNDNNNNNNKSNEYFRLNPYCREFEFCNLSTINENIRFVLLKLRDRNEPEFNHMIIPNNIKEIPFNILDDYKIRKNNEKSIDDNDNDDDFERKLIKNRKQLERIYTRIFQNCKNYQNNLSYDSVVNENFYIEEKIKQFLNSCIKWLKLHTNLLKDYEIIDNNRKNVQLESLQERKDALIFIKILSIENFELFSFNDNNKQLNISIEFELNNKIINSRIKNMVDSNIWNEQLILPLDNLHIDYLNPNSLNGLISINIYNENHANQKFLLGYGEIPLSIIYFSKLTCSIRIKTPRLSFEAFDEISDMNVKNREILLNLEIDINPKIPVLIPSVAELPCNETPFIKDYAINWNRNYNNNHPDRKFSIFTIDINGATTCIVRYIKPIEPPPINNENFNVSEEQCVRFITLIPFVYYNQFYQNVWLSTDQFLQLTIGSIIDHAVALTCYLLALKKNVWLLLGFSNHYGPTGFVLIRNPDQHHQIYDVVTGCKYNLDDKYCPLKNIYCVVNSNNLWANLQRNNPINLTRFDFNRKSDWLPLFDDRTIQMPTSFMHGKCNYLQIIDNTDDFEIILEQRIRKKFSKLRPLQRTIWNQTISNMFKKILNSFESMILYQSVDNDIFKPIKPQLAPFQIRGQIWDLPFTNISTMVKRINMLGLQQINESKTEFISAISVKSYPNNILVIWIFLGTVQPKPI